MDVLDARLCLLLHSLPRLSDLSLSRLFQRYGSAREIWASHSSAWRSLGISEDTIVAARAIQTRGVGESTPSFIDRQLEALQELEAEVVSLGDRRYPVLLQTLYDPPPILYVRGEVALLQQAQLAMVGSRRASPPGRRAALQLSGDCVRAGLHVCSGLAMGIDEAAHRGALDAGGKTVAVMATGLDVVYPTRHRGLAQELVVSGCLLTEFPPGCRPLRHRFPQRNRIISGLSLGVLVVEAALRSGSLITARTGMEQGREVFALPWSMFHPGGRGCLALLRDGVSMVQGIEDILEELGPLYQYQREVQEAQAQEEDGEVAAVAPGEEAVLRLIGSDVISVDEIVQFSGLAVAPVLAALSTLEVKRRIIRCAGGYIHC